MVKLFMKQLEIKKIESGQNSNMFQNGLNKLKETHEIVNDLQASLTAMKPDLEVQKKKTEEFHVQVKEETRQAEIIRM